MCNGDPVPVTCRLLFFFFHYIIAHRHEQKLSRAQHFPPVPEKRNCIYVLILFSLSEFTAWHSLISSSILEIKTYFNIFTTWLWGLSCCKWDISQTAASQLRLHCQPVSTFGLLDDLGWGQVCFGQLRFFVGSDVTTVCLSSQIQGERLIMKCCHVENNYMCIH